MGGKGEGERGRGEEEEGKESEGRKRGRRKKRGTEKRERGRSMGEKRGEGHRTTIDHISSRHYHRHNSLAARLRECYEREP